MMMETTERKTPDNPNIFPAGLVNVSGLMQFTKPTAF
jgi:hypothetical protein